MRIFSHSLMYCNKAREFTQPVLTEDGTIGGNDFAVCARRTDTGKIPVVVENAYKIADGDTSTFIPLGGGTYIGNPRLWIGLYNPNAIRMDETPTITMEKVSLNGIWGTNDKTIFDEAMDTGGTQGMEKILFDTPRKYFKFYKLVFWGTETTPFSSRVYEIELHCSEKLKGE